jgi:ornithine cyclodeaminase
MPAYMHSPHVMGAKVVSVYPGNHGTDRDSHQGAVLLFDADNGAVLSLMDGSSITAIRTAAVSAVATRALSRPESSRLAIIGSAVQARTHVSAMLLVRPINTVHVWSRNPLSASEFAAWVTSHHDVDVECHTSAQDAVARSDIVCTVTASREPVLRGEWLMPGTHINAVGSSSPTSRELDAAAVARSRFFVDRRESTLNEAGDFLLAREESAVGDEHILAEIGEVLTGVISGRTSPDDITLFKALGLAVEDLAAAHHIYVTAQGNGAGVRVELGGARDSGT